MLEQSVFAARRQRLLSQMQPNSMAIIAAAPEIFRNNDSPYRYRQHSDFYYLTGFPEPNAVAVLMPDGDQGQYILFNQVNNKMAEVWTGTRVGQRDACTVYLADQAFAIDSLDEILPQLMQDKDIVYYPLGVNQRTDRSIIKWRDQLLKKVRQGVTAPHQLHDLNAMIHEMRLIKSEQEIAVMRQVAEISAQAHIRAMQVAPSAQFEYQLEAELLYYFHAHGCRAPAYDPIVAGGKNACILHYTANNARIDADQLMLIDAGGELDNYAADITRTFPVNGQFSPEQTAVYEIVLQAQLTGIEQARAGQPFSAMQTEIVKVITQGLCDLKILTGDVDALIEDQAYRDFYMHNSGHWLGLDVHDAGEYKIDKQWRPLQAGMVITVEPGLYLSGDNPAVPSAFHNIGIRIEDDVLITNQQPEVLSHSAPKTIHDIEQVMAAAEER